MAYIDAARTYQTAGTTGVLAIFEWNSWPRTLISILIASLASITGLGLENSAYALGVVFISGTCVLLVRCSETIFPGTGWMAGLAVLVIPALNKYRDYIIREFGAWFFLFLALWLMLRWLQTGGWTKQATALVMVLVAAMFRPECLLFALLFPVLIVNRLAEGRQIRQSAIIALSATATFIILPLLIRVISEMFGGGGVLMAGLNPFRESGWFANRAEEMALHVLPSWSAKDAATILAAGLTVLIPVKLMGTLGILTIPLVTGFLEARKSGSLVRFRLFLWALLIYGAVLVWFVLERQYLTGRYVALLGLLTIPIVALGLLHVYRCWPRWRWLMLGLMGIMIISNVISTSPPKTRFSDAAKWLSVQPYEASRVSIDTHEVAYLLGRDFLSSRQGISGHEQASAALREGRIDLSLIDTRKIGPDFDAWVQRQGLMVVARFTDRSGRTIVAVKTADRHLNR